MDTSQHLQLPLKLKTLKLLAVIAAVLAFFVLGLPLYAASIQGVQQAMLYVMSIHLGIYIIAQWINFECRAVNTRIKLYSFNEEAAQVAENYHGVICSLPMISLLAAMLSFLALI